MGMEQLPFWVRLTQHPAYDEYWQGQAVDRILARSPLAVPTLLVDSLWDQEDIYGAPAVYEAVKRSDNAHLVLGPWHHGQANGPAMTLGPLDFNGDTGKWFRSNVMMPFLDQYLKGGPPANTAKVTAFEAQTNQWRRLPTGRRRACAAARQTSHRSISLPAQGSASKRQGHGLDSYVSDPAKPVTYRVAAEPLAVDPGLDLALLAPRRSALRRRRAPTS